MAPSSIAPVFRACCEAILKGVLIVRENRRDKEFPFQDWFQARLTDAAIAFDPPTRHGYPDFSLVATPEGYEIKGLELPGREASYDANSKLPARFHNQRRVFYVFGRYPKDAPEKSYPVLDLVICDGNFLNVDRGYIHENGSVKGFGSYGDIGIRDRKMYNPPTPYALLTNVAYRRTLILAADEGVPAGFTEVGAVVRKEVDDVVIGYAFDFATNALTSRTAKNPYARTEHSFRALRLTGDNDSERVTLADAAELIENQEAEMADADADA